MNRTKKRKIHKTSANALAFGLIASGISLFLTALIGAIIASFLDNPTSSIGAISFITLIVAGGVSGFSTSKYKGEGGVMPAMLSALVFAIVLLVIGFIMSDGKLPLVTFINLVVYFISATFFAIIGKKRDKKHKRR